MYAVLLVDVFLQLDSAKALVESMRSVVLIWCDLSREFMCHGIVELFLLL